MIFYSPTNNDVLTRWIKYNPRSAFIMTQLDGFRSGEVVDMLAQLDSGLSDRDISFLDASSVVTGRDFHTKIYNLALSVPIGIAVVSETMEPTTIANIYYEVGLMNALGKETVVIKTKDFSVPSDFVRTEYINFSTDFSNQLYQFLDQTFEQAEYYGIIAKNLDAKPLLSIDYLRRAFLITGQDTYKQQAIRLIDANQFDEHILLMIKSYFNITS